MLQWHTLQFLLTDNDIFSELKIMLHYKDLEKERVKFKADTLSWVSACFK